MDEMHHRILVESVDMFFKYGIRSITMDDLSRDLGMSKKTLYKYVKNKADLVDQGVRFKFNEVASAIKEFGSNLDNAIDELFAIDAYIDVMMLENHPAMMFQLSKYYPKTYKWLEKSKEELMTEITTANLKKGLQQELYRPSIKVDYITYIYMAHAQSMDGQTNIPEEVCHSAEFHKHHMEYHIRGIASAKGLEYLNQKIKQK